MGRGRSRHEPGGRAKSCRGPDSLIFLLNWRIFCWSQLGQPPSFVETRNCRLTALQRALLSTFKGLHYESRIRHRPVIVIIICEGSMADACNRPFKGIIDTPPAISPSDGRPYYNDSNTIALLPSTTLKYSENTLEPHEMTMKHSNDFCHM